MTSSSCGQRGAGRASPRAASARCSSVRRVIRLPPAEAMRPAAPPSYAQGGFDARAHAPARRLGAHGRARDHAPSHAHRCSARSASAPPPASSWWASSSRDAMDYLVDFYIQKPQRETLAVTLRQPAARSRAARSRALCPACATCSGSTMLPVRVRAGHRERSVAVIGHPERHAMRPLLDADGDEVPLERGRRAVHRHARARARTSSPATGDRRAAARATARRAS